MDYIMGRHRRDDDSPRRHRRGSSDDNEDEHRRRDERNHVDHRRGRERGFGNGMDSLANKPTYRIYCRAGGDRFSVAVRENKVVLVSSDAHHDTQHWYKDERFSSKAKDEEGHYSFALVNKATGQVMKHFVQGEQVTLVPYDPDDGLDLSILWTESNDVGNGFKNVRMVNDIKLVMDAFHGDQDHGGVQNGTRIALYECWNGDNQQWKIIPY